VLYQDMCIINQGKTSLLTPLNWDADFVKVLG
jgi:hypothetical protein